LDIRIFRLQILSVAYFTGAWDLLGEPSSSQSQSDDSSPSITRGLVFSIFQVMAMRNSLIALWIDRLIIDRLIRCSIRFSPSGISRVCTDGGVAQIFGRDAIPGPEPCQSVGVTQFPYLCEMPIPICISIELTFIVGFWLDRPYGIVVLCVAAGLGFSTIENLGYVLFDDSDVGYFVALMRAFMDIAQHSITGALIGVRVALKDHEHHSFWHVMAVPFLVHGFYDVFLMIPSR
jgi:hypothetical protein